MKRILCWILGFTALAGQAETLQVEYSRFYSHVKKIAKEETADLRFAFGFQHLQQTRLCTIQEAFIYTPKQIIALEVGDQQRFTVPAERALKLADAIVVIELTEAANLCDMSVQLETQPNWLKSAYTNQELSHLLGQYNAFFDNMGGILSFMMPKVNGLVVQMPRGYQPAANLKSLAFDNRQFVLPESWIASGARLELGATPIRIIAQTDG